MKALSSEQRLVSEAWHAGMLWLT